MPSRYFAIYVKPILKSIDQHTPRRQREIDHEIEIVDLSGYTVNGAGQGTANMVRHLQLVEDVDDFQGSPERLPASHSHRPYRELSRGP